MFLVGPGSGCLYRGRDKGPRLNSKVIGMKVSANCELPATSCSDLTPSQIIGILLVQNEERFVEQAVRNAIDFCDHLLLVDHHSCDQTVSLLEHLQNEYPQKTTLYQIEHPRESHDLLQPFVGTKSWIFGVDGDELYDRERLAEFRLRILAGEFDQEWMILGNVLHVDQLDEVSAHVSGYLAPPSRSITKLYHFAALTAWQGETPERLHGGQPQFRSGFHAQKKRLLQYEYAWEESPLRCLHLCFLQRSSVETSEQRSNIMEREAARGVGWLKKRVRSFFSLSEPPSWKEQHYRRGKRLMFDASPFFKKTSKNKQ